MTNRVASKNFTLEKEYLDESKVTTILRGKQRQWWISCQSETGGLAVRVCREMAISFPYYGYGRYRIPMGSLCQVIAYKPPKKNLLLQGTTHNLKVSIGSYVTITCPECLGQSVRSPYVKCTFCYQGIHTPIDVGMLNESYIDFNQLAYLLKPIPLSDDGIRIHPIKYAGIPYLIIVGPWWRVYVKANADLTANGSHLTHLWARPYVTDDEKDRPKRRIITT